MSDQEASDLDLSARQVEILHHIAAGRSTEEAAARMYLGANTVKTHTRGLFRRIGVGTRLEAAVWLWSRP